MKKGLRFIYMLMAIICFSIIAKSQSNKQLAYTVTDSLQNGVKWNYLRKIDLRTGIFSNILLRLLNSSDIGSNSSLPNGVAAIALDEKGKRLYFTPLFTDKLNYVDLKTMRIYTVTNTFTGLFPKAADQSNVFTRMVIADDENGYALTNDGKHLVKFNTNSNSVTSLGPLVNAPQNEVSVHEVCSSYGGDIIAADNDLLYLITSRNHVFKINIKTKLASYQGTITGLSQNFVTSGAAVDYRDNRIVIGSSVDGSDIYSVNVKTLAAIKLNAANSVLSSDLANSNMLKIKKQKDDEDDERNIFVNANQADNNLIQIYPNPVTKNEFKIRFTNFTNSDAGSYLVNIVSVTGQVISTTKIENHSGKSNIVKINLPALTGKGVYIVRITDKNNKTVFSEKIILL